MSPQCFTETSGRLNASCAITYTSYKPKPPKKSAMVSWVRRKSGDTALQLLTVGKQTYSGDSRYQIEFQYPNNWRLKITRANKNDEGVYECQISTHPPKVIIYYLYVNVSTR
uniref:Ig-like domain-containing protein n=1 Tax=Anopheles maculatus TaxID=74869 RepID=A0A182SDL6_9DIPT